MTDDPAGAGAQSPVGALVDDYVKAVAALLAEVGWPPPRCWLDSTGYMRVAGPGEIPYDSDVWPAYWRATAKANRLLVRARPDLVEPLDLGMWLVEV